MQTIRQQYLARSFQEDALLKFGSKLLSDPTTMKDLNTFGDNLIAIEAITPADLPNRMPRQPELPRQPEQPLQSRQPLQPSNIQPTVKPSLPDSESLKPKAEFDRRYGSPYAPRGVTPVTSRTSGSIKAEPSVDQQGLVPPVTRMAPNLPMADQARKPTAKAQALQQDVQRAPQAIRGWKNVVSTAVAEARAILARDPTSKVEGLPATVQPQLSGLALHDNAERERLKLQNPSLNDGTAPALHYSIVILTLCSPG